MDLGSLGSYRLPASMRDVYVVTTAQELADQLGVTTLPTASFASEADAAYQHLRRGDSGPARALLVDKLGVSESAAADAIARFPKQ